MFCCCCCWCLPLFGANFLVFVCHSNCKEMSSYRDTNPRALQIMNDLCEIAFIFVFIFGVKEYASSFSDFYFPLVPIFLYGLSRRMRSQEEVREQRNLNWNLFCFFFSILFFKTFVLWVGGFWCEFCIEYIKSNVSIEINQIRVILFIEINATNWSIHSTRNRNCSM